jgi:hypothetical protein
MSPRLARRIGGFALRFALAYGLLVLAWPLLRPVFRPCYCALGNLLFGDGLLGGEASAHFRPLELSGQGDVELDIGLVLTKRGPPPVTARMENNSRLVGYMPMVSLVAFVLASPIPWKRRRRALLIGLALVSAFVAVRMAIPILRDFSNPDALQVFRPGASARRLLEIAERALLRAPASFFVVPIFLWILVAFRREDWEIVAEPEPPA